MLFHVNEFRRAVYLLPHEDEDFAASTTLALQSVFIELQVIVCGAYGKWVVWCVGQAYGVWGAWCVGGVWCLGSVVYGAYSVWSV